VMMSWERGLPLSLSIPGCRLARPSSRCAEGCYWLVDLLVCRCAGPCVVGVLFSHGKLVGVAVGVAVGAADADLHKPRGCAQHPGLLLVDCLVVVFVYGI
jgi:hypothetical protein